MFTANCSPRSLIGLKPVSVANLFEALWKTFTREEKDGTEHEMRAQLFEKILSRRTDDKWLPDLIHCMRIMQYSDSACVKKVLYLISSHMHSYSYSVKQRILSDFGLRFCDKEEGLKRVSYFLEYATIGRYRMGQMRAVELMLALMDRGNRYAALSPNVMWALLRYGTVDLVFEKSSAFPGNFTIDAVPSFIRHGVQYPNRPLLHELVYFLQQYNLSLKLLTGASESDLDLLEDIEKHQEIRGNISVISSALRYIPKGFLTTSNGQGLNRHKGLQEADLTSALENIAITKPDLGLILSQRFNEKVTSLKHLCRCQIRTALYENWQLPGGVYRLGLHPRLSQYLDLGA